MKVDSIYDLSNRANINIKTTEHSQVVVYEDHRSILNVLFYLKKNKKATFPINIILFDDHDDSCKPSEEALRIIKGFNKREPELREFWSFTEFDLRTLDDDWIKAGMELGLINHLFLFNASQSSIGLITRYKTMKFGEKKIYNLGYLWDCLSHRGLLYDVVKRQEYGELWKDFGWEYDKKSGRFDFNPSQGFIVDFDLDCFTTKILDNRVAIPEDILFDKFTEHHQPNYHYFYTYQMFVKKLIEESALTTICFENGFCGGYRQCFKIFDMVDQLFFDNELGK